MKQAIDYVKKRYSKFLREFNFDLLDRYFNEAFSNDSILGVDIVSVSFKEYQLSGYKCELHDEFNIRGEIDRKILVISNKAVPFVIRYLNDKGYIVNVADKYRDGWSIRLSEDKSYNITALLRVWLYYQKDDLSRYDLKKKDFIE